MEIDKQIIEVLFDKYICHVKAVAVQAYALSVKDPIECAEIAVGLFQDRFVYSYISEMGKRDRISEVAYDDDEMLADYYRRKIAVTVYQIALGAVRIYRRRTEKNNG